MVIDFLKIYAILNAVSLFLIVFRKDWKEYLYFIIQFIFRPKFFELIFSLILAFVILPTVIPFSLKNIALIPKIIF